jgi:hypothetical protein
MSELSDVRDEHPHGPGEDERRHLQRVQQRGGVTYNQALVPATATSAGSWLAPTSVLQARFFKVSAQIDF